jgi:hypothetical protein
MNLSRRTIFQFLFVLVFVSCSLQPAKISREVSSEMSDVGSSSMLEPTSPEILELYFKEGMDNRALRYISDEELLRPYTQMRKNDPRFNVDQCVPGLEGDRNFGEIVDFFISAMMGERERDHLFAFQGSRVPKDADIARIFNLSTPDPFLDFSEVLHCENFALEEFKERLGPSSKKHSEEELQMLMDKSHRWASKLNGYVREGKKTEVHNVFSRLARCLGFVESLDQTKGLYAIKPSTDNQLNHEGKVKELKEKIMSIEYGKKIAYRSWLLKLKEMGINEIPEDVDVYVDYQMKNLPVFGLFQFTPSVDDNVRTCVEQWNLIYGKNNKCVISTSDKNDIFKALVSPKQVFNAYCGVKKIQQMMAVQKYKKTDEEASCISIHRTPKKTYNHFGPFIGTTGPRFHLDNVHVVPSNMDKLLTCALDEK